MLIESRGVAFEGTYVAYQWVDVLMTLSPIIPIIGARREQRIAVAEWPSRSATTCRRGPYPRGW